MEEDRQNFAESFAEPVYCLRQMGRRILNKETPSVWLLFMAQERYKWTVLPTLTGYRDH